MNTSPTRLQLIDLAKGIVMLLVIAGHVFWGPGHVVFPDGVPADNAMTTFRMPLYFMLCGIFFKTYDGIGTFLKKKINNQLIPYAVFYLFGLVTGIYGAIWFLGCLFLVNVLGYLLFLLPKRDMPKYAKVLIFIAFTLLAGFFGSLIPSYLGTAIVALPFFLSGYFLRKGTDFISAQKMNLGKSLVLTTLCLGIVALVCGLCHWPDAVFAINEYHLPLPLLYVCGFAGTMAMLFLAKALVRVPVVSYIGRYSIIVLLTHPIFIYGFSRLEGLVFGTKMNAYYWTVVFFLVILLEVPTIWFCKKYLPWAFAQKEVLKTN